MFSLQKLHQGFISTIYGAQNVDNSLLYSVSENVAQTNIHKEHLFSDIFSSHLVSAVACAIFNWWEAQRAIKSEMKKMFW